MAKNSLIRTLPAEEQQALSLCGITQDAQLAQIGPHALRRDLETAAALFPDTLQQLPGLERLEYLCQQAAGIPSMPAEDAAQLWQNSAAGVATTPSGTKSRRVSAATGRVLVDDSLDPKQAVALDDRHRRDDPRGFNHAICCQHPFATYLGAWATVLLFFAIGALILGVIGLLIGIDYKDIAIPAIIVLGVLILFYAIMLGMATCSTCRIAIFSFRRYPRHRKAHRFPLLGYTLSTALYVIFMFRYRCPSCGTTQKFFGKRHRRR